MPRQTTVLSVSLPPKLSKAVDKLSKQTSQTRSELIRNALRDYILNFEEDITLSKLAELRDTNNAKYLSHKEVWG
ncbi:MAG: Ribbon-helix-helix protein, CopG family [Candidatus Uhrbacteria bacterium GW2011_GWA2_52_8d]|uniref:Ribbon-helix-helix protein, CopG family n=1 Tax=Candidatus Uhrbacteria bacterium GW2011_GWA2_52_8d TaxID=1618979 RepID=A0A0G2AI46_9BACT|nr:MAG: Ribbon-helix-helix protein, CopG family [Candidatus Uhrbacteria bacterium GW2011_GWA2_52_8d]